MRDLQITASLLIGATVLGFIAQPLVPRGPWTLVISTAVAGVALTVAGFVLRGRFLDTLGGFRFATSLLGALAVAAAVGTLILQGKPAAFYAARYGAVGPAIVALHFDDLFHSLWFGALMALLIAGLVISAVRRPLNLKNLGFYCAHLGVLITLAGAGLSTTMQQKGRINLHVNGPAVDTVLLEDEQGRATTVPLGATVSLQRFDTEKFKTEYRVGIYQADKNGNFRLKASFDPDVDVKHRLPGDGWYRIAAYYPDFVYSETEPRFSTRSQEPNNPAVLLELFTDSGLERKLLLAKNPSGVRVSEDAGLVFERREEEVKAWRSQVRVEQNGAVKNATIAVNDPLSVGGWELYQANFDPNDPTYSGINAVKDPGVPFVFAGFFFLAAGILWMFYVLPQLRKA